MFQGMVDAYDRWPYRQVQCNYIDVENHAGKKGLVRGLQGLAAIIMEPLLGGRLMDPLQPNQALWDTAAVRWTRWNVVSCRGIASGAQ